MQFDLGKYAYMAKAVAAFIALLITFLTTIATVLTDGQIKVEEVVAVLVAGGTLVGGSRAVFQVKNEKTKQ